MSSTITETERRSVLSPSTPVELLTSKRQHLSRTGSIEKLKNFNNYICSQHYYMLPSLLLWLKTSQTLLTANVEKCIVHVKSMFLLCTLRELALARCAVGADRVSSIGETKHKQVTARDVLPVLHALLARVATHCSTVGDRLKHVALVLAVYCAVFVVFLQLVACVLLICVRAPPIGFVFLVVCVAFMGRIAAHVLYGNRRAKPSAADRRKQTTSDDEQTTKEKRVLRKRLSFIGKTISNVKLF